MIGFDPRSGVRPPYGALLDTRRRIIANAWARSATIAGRDDATPSVYDEHIFATSAGDVLDLTAGCPGNYWRVVASHTGGGDRVVHVRVGASTSASRVYDLVVGTEVTGTIGEIDYVQRVMRSAAWRLYGATGGTHIIRSWTTHNGTCFHAHVCFRNRATCSPSAIMHPTGSTPSLAVDICRNIAGFTGGSSAWIQDSVTMTHELSHLLTANGTLNNLWDEYWTSRDVSGICGRAGYTVARCQHSLMADTEFWRDLASYCTDATHDRVVEVMNQATSTAMNIVVIGQRSLAGATGATSTPIECWDGVTTTYAGGDGSAPWSVLYNTGAAPLPHPAWSPDNHDYVNFSDGPSDDVVGFMW